MKFIISESQYKRIIYEVGEPILTKYPCLKGKGNYNKTNNTVTIDNFEYFSDGKVVNKQNKETGRFFCIGAGIDIKWDNDKVPIQTDQTYVKGIPTAYGEWAKKHPEAASFVTSSFKIDWEEFFDMVVDGISAITEAIPGAGQVVSFTIDQLHAVSYIIRAIIDMKNGDMEQFVIHYLCATITSLTAFIPIAGNFGNIAMRNGVKATVKQFFGMTPPAILKFLKDNGIDLGVNVLYGKNLSKQQWEIRYWASLWKLLRGWGLEKVATLLTKAMFMLIDYVNNFLNKAKETSQVVTGLTKKAMDMAKEYAKDLNDSFTITEVNSDVDNSGLIGNRIPANMTNIKAFQWYVWGKIERDMEKDPNSCDVNGQNCSYKSILCKNKFCKRDEAVDGYWGTNTKKAWEQYKNSYYKDGYSTESKFEDMPRNFR